MDFARAMEPIPRLDIADDRVRYIVGLMRDGLWPAWPKSREFRQRIAEAWGIAESTVRNYSAEAHRQIAVDPEERAEIQERVASDLLGIATEARAMKNEVTGLPDFASAIRATTEAAKFLGIEPATKVEHSGQVSLESVDDIRKRLEAAKAKK